MRPSRTGQWPHASVRSGDLDMKGTALADLALSLSGSAGTPAGDETGVTGRFDFALSATLTCLQSGRWSRE
jgi:uncharacterized protein (TIGR03435 family)